MKPPIEFRQKMVSPKRASDSGGVQFPLADRDQVRKVVQVHAEAEVIAEVNSPGGPGGSDSRERPAPTDIQALKTKLTSGLPPSEARQLTEFLNRIEHKRGVKAAQMQRYRARKKAK